MCTTPRDWEPCHKWSAIYGEYSHHFHKWKHSGHHWTHCGSWHVLLGHAVSQGHHIQFHPMTPILLDLMLVKSANWCELLSKKKIKLLILHTCSHLSIFLSFCQNYECREEIQWHAILEQPICVCMEMIRDDWGYGSFIWLWHGAKKYLLTCSKAKGSQSHLKFFGNQWRGWSKDKYNFLLRKQSCWYNE